MGTDGAGVFASYDGGTIWADLNAGLEVREHVVEDLERVDVTGVWSPCEASGHRCEC